MLTVKHAITTALILLFVAPLASAQDDSVHTGWKTSLGVDLTLAQTAYSESWTGGELGALSWVGNLNFSAEKQLSELWNFKTTLRMSFGQTHSQKLIVDESGNEEKIWEKPKKSTDLIDWENVARLTHGWEVDPYVAFRLESQFLDASNESKKRYFNPIKLTESAGLSKKLYARDDNEILTRLGIAFRQILSNVIVDDVSLETDDSTETDVGIESVTDVKFTLHKNIQYVSKLSLYKALYYSKKDDVAGTEFEDDWKAIDVNFENTITANITKVIAVNLYMQFLYDKEVDKRGRLKETLGIGFAFKLI
jgi:hypothetical protein